MNRPEADMFFRQIAGQYVEQYGQSLKQELAELKKSASPSVTPGLDRRVKRGIRAPDRKRNIRIIGALAACLALVLLIPRLALLSEPRSTSSEAPMEQSEAITEEGQSAVMEIIPLSFALPDNLSVENVKLDQGKSVYFLNNTQLDDVVMTLEMTPGYIAHEGLVEIKISQSTVYGVSGPDYNLLTFQKEGVAYVLTCKHDINTLIALSRSIL